MFAVGADQTAEEPSVANSWTWPAQRAVPARGRLSAALLTFMALGPNAPKGSKATWSEPFEGDAVPIPS